MSRPIDQSLLTEQADYYRARAPEYDRWWFREGRFDHGEAANAAWFAEAAEVAAALDSLPLDGAHVLELAPGTGIWTEHLARRAQHVTAVDASPEMMALNRERIGELAARVEYVRADLFEWRAPSAADGVVFCFWISHVPDDRLASFLGGVAESIRPGGFIFFLDGLPEPTSTAQDHVLPAEGDPVMTRRLDDGREFQMVKAFRDSAVLAQAARCAGLDVEVLETATYFQYARGTRRA